MKKTIIALATVAVFASSANAATVFEKDGTKVDVNGEIGVALTKFKNERVDLVNHESKLQFNVSHKINDNLSALGGVEIGFEDENDPRNFGNPKLNKLFAGFDVNNVGKFTFGKQSTNGDDVLLNNHAHYFKAENNLFADADKSVKFRSADMHGFGFGLDYAFGDSARNNTSLEIDDDTEYKDKYAYQASLFYKGDLSQNISLDLATGYFVDKSNLNTTTKTAFQSSGWRVASQITFGPVAFGAEYGQTIFKEKLPAEFKARTITDFLVGASYQIAEPMKVYAQWQRGETRQHGDEINYVEDGTIVHSYHTLPNSKIQSDTFVLGSDYKFNSNVIVYAEFAREVEKDKRTIVYSQGNSTNQTVIGREVLKGTKVTDNRFGVGLRVLF